MSSKDNLPQPNPINKERRNFSLKLWEKVKYSYLRSPKFWKNMFAIVKIAGHQFKVKAGQQIYVSHINGNVGDKIDIPDVLLVDNDGTLSVGKDVKEKVSAEIISEIQGDKVIAFKMKRRKGFRKKIGHRKLYTKLMISSIA
jgi:large subunit ribosomal protein L21